MPRRRATDPRRAQADRFVGGSGPYSRDDVLVDVDKAVLMAEVEVCTVQVGRDGVMDPNPRIALQLSGRVNKSKDEVSVLFLFDEDGAAAIVSQLQGMASRYGGEYGERLLARLGRMPL